MNTIIYTIINRQSLSFIVQVKSPLVSQDLGGGGKGIPLRVLNHVQRLAGTERHQHVAHKDRRPYVKE